MTPDLRLLPAALAAWAVALAGLHLGWPAATALGVAGAGAVVAGARARRRWSAGVLGAGGVAAALALVIGGHAWTAGHHPVHLAADRGAACLLYTSPSPRDRTRSRMPSSA